jgi:hypothetical protein
MLKLIALVLVFAALLMQSCSGGDMRAMEDGNRSASLRAEWMD